MRPPTAASPPAPRAAMLPLLVCAAALASAALAAPRSATGAPGGSARARMTVAPPTAATDPPGVRRAYNLAPHIPSPYRALGNDTPTYYNAPSEYCGSVFMEAPSELGRVVDPNGGDLPETGNDTFNATIAWFKMEPACAVPISVMEFSGCLPRRPLGACAVQTLPRWLGYDNFSAPSEDLLGLHMHAPPAGINGLYVRLVEVANRTEVVRFALSQRDYPPCPYSKPAAFHSGACLTPSRFDEGVSVDAIAMSSRYIPENQRRLVDYLLRDAGWEGSKTPSRGVFIPRNVSLPEAAPPPTPGPPDAPLDPLVDDFVPGPEGPAWTPGWPGDAPEDDGADSAGGDAGPRADDGPVGPGGGAWTRVRWPVVGGAAAGVAAALAVGVACACLRQRRRGFRHTRLPLIRGN
ncbi:envelope glycoprotein D [Ateline alphaherpesvirus 1]|uniref:Envelope glycoprotein D n=1 Tax=Herpesvirus ateles type 1 (strain Lennette) TaxID=35243 RepID=A0A1S6JLS0_HSVA1|nr:envelope glycoprotein D [Ateline alphaherpesvirus 1]AQS79223.1 envelope glycoprotein D [Ateline alphaherpesvirus 1]